MANSLKEHNFFGFDATVVADSKNPFGDRITTMVVTFPRIVLAEFNTHRMFSRNSASSRAIPFAKMVERVKTNPFIPVAWQKEHKGMQGTEYFDFSANDQTKNELVGQWLSARDLSVNRAEELTKLGATKQLANRLLEPFLWHTVIVTATEWENFFTLRCPQYGGTHELLGDVIYRSKKDAINAMKEVGVNTSIIEKSSILQWLQVNKSHADIHIALAAEAMWDAYNESIPKELQAGEWHLPFEEEMDSKAISDLCIEHTVPVLYVKKAISVATCARISFGNINPSDVPIAKNIDMYDDLRKKRHASPFEHIDQCMSENEYESYYRGDSDDWGWCDNFKGFISERHKLGI